MFMLAKPHDYACFNGTETNKCENHVKKGGGEAA